MRGCSRHPELSAEDERALADIDRMREALRHQVLGTPTKWMLQGHRHTARKPAGQWRKGAVYVTDVRDPSIAAHTAPPAVELSGLMGELIDWLNAEDSTQLLVRAAMAHLQLVSSIRGPTAMVGYPVRCRR